MFTYIKANAQQVVLSAAGIVLLFGLLLYHLGSLTIGLSAVEQQTATTPLGWHGLYHHPFYLPLTFVRSIVFFLFAHHGQTLTRLPNILFGALSILAFAALIKLWHSTRTAFLATLLFATNAWVLHVSRLASYDVLYLWAMPVLLLIYMAMQKGYERPVVFYGSALLLGLLLYIPGLVWLVILEVFWLRSELLEGWKYFDRVWERILYGLSYIIWLPLLVWRLHNINNLRMWLGLPAHLATPFTLLKQLVAVGVHLFIRGPQYPQVWLGRTPMLDLFTLAVCLLGIYFYVTHLSTTRSRVLISWFVVGAVLVGLGGPVSLSLMVPLVYIAVATGIAYLLHRWLHVFPLNPLARGFGIGLIVVAVAVSSVYNLRAYFIAWPHNPTTQATFHYRR